MPQRPQPKKPRSTSKREDILRSSMKILCHYGFDGATLEKIADDAGVSKALIIRFFGSKRELLVLCLTRHLEQLVGRAQQLAGQEAQTFREYWGRIFAVLKEERASLRFVISLLATPAHADIMQSIIPSTLLDSGELLVRFPDVRDPGRARDVNHMMLSLLVSYIIGGNEEHYIRVRDVVLEQFLFES